MNLNLFKEGFDTLPTAVCFFDSRGIVRLVNEKMIEIANRHNFPDDIIDLIKDNPIKFFKYQKFDNGRGIGRYYANLIRQMNR